mgnify:CR=1 FL=1
MCSAISAILPLLMAFAVSPDWSLVLWTAALFLVVDPQNLPARRLYDRVGFGGTHWLLMAKRL